MSRELQVSIDNQTEITEGDNIGMDEFDDPSSTVPSTPLDLEDSVVDPDFSWDAFEGELAAGQDMRSIDELSQETGQNITQALELPEVSSFMTDDQIRQALLSELNHREELPEVTTEYEEIRNPTAEQPTEPEPAPARQAIRNFILGQKTVQRSEAFPSEWRQTEISLNIWEEDILCDIQGLKRIGSARVFSDGVVQKYARYGLPLLKCSVSQMPYTHIRVYQSGSSKLRVYPGCEHPECGECSPEWSLAIPQCATDHFYTNNCGLLPWRLNIQGLSVCSWSDDLVS